MIYLILIYYHFTWKFLPGKSSKTAFKRIPLIHAYRFLSVCFTFTPQNKGTVNSSHTSEQITLDIEEVNLEGNVFLHLFQSFPHGILSYPYTSQRAITGHELKWMKFVFYLSINGFLILHIVIIWHCYHNELCSLIVYKTHDKKKHELVF